MKARIHTLLAVVTLASATSTAAPRTLATGAPAAGNVVGKPLPTDPHEDARRAHARARAVFDAALVEEREAKQLLATNPRTLPNGSPACGNTGGKDVCTAQLAGRLYRERVTRVRAAERARRHAQRELTEAQRQVRATSARPRRDGTA